MRDYQRGLSLARLKSVLHFDPSTGDWTRLVDRGGQLAGTRAGCLTKRGYEVMLIDGYMYYSHRLAWFYMTGEWPPEEIDHRDMNKRNNRWDNLRLATSSQNKRNAVKPRSNKTGFKGVTLVRGKYHRASISKDGKSTLLGYFESPEAAHAAYCKAANEIAGEFARPE